MQTIQMLVLVTAIAALIAGLNVAQVAHAQSKGTCVVNSDTTVANNVKTGILIVLIQNNRRRHQIQFVAQ